MYKTCDTCACNKVCDHDKYGFENCDNYVQAVRHSEWESNGIAMKCNQCEKCLVIEQGDAEMNYCPNCGAKMDGERKDRE